MPLPRLEILCEKLRLTDFEKGVVVMVGSDRRRHLWPTAEPIALGALLTVAGVRSWLACS